MALFDDILKQIGVSVGQFNRSIPGIQKKVLEEVELAVKKLELTKDNRIKTTIENLRVIRNIKDKILKLILTDEYKQEVKEFRQAFDAITKLQNDYWKQLDKRFRPSSILKEIRKQTIEDTVSKLTEAGIGVNIGDKISDILRTNITTGGSYAQLTNQLRESLTTTKTPGTLERYTKQITTDALNQYSAQYTQTVASDLGYEWFKYDNTDIDTTRPFCDAMTDKPYFHISQIPALLRADGLTYVNKKGERVAVPIYGKTGLPHGMIPGTNASNFFVFRGGYNCGHQIRPTIERQVPQDVIQQVKGTPDYIRWSTSAEATQPPQTAQQKDITALIGKALQAGPEVDKLARDIAAKYGAKVTPINYKEESSITRKVNDEYNGDVSQVKDAVRNTIIAPKGRIEEVIAEFERMKVPEGSTAPGVVRVKRQSGPDFLGYSGTVINYRARNGLITEVQVNTAKMIYAKQGGLKVLGQRVYDRIHRETGLPAALGHKYYDEHRKLNAIIGPTPEQVNRLRELENLSEEYYSHFR